ncbi:MAG: type IV pilus assembly protein FimV [Candidatus Binatia bacterium]
MESKMMGGAGGGFLIAVGLWSAAAGSWSVLAQDTAGGGQAEINLRRSAQSRPYQGREVEGEERQIVPGDTLWRMLVRDKGLPGQHFHSYLVVIRGLNPQIKDPQILRVGDKIFIPLRPDQVAGARPVSDLSADRSNSGRGTTTNYRVKAGEHLYQILREQLKPTDELKLAQYYALVKDLNPERKNWDSISEGEIIRLPMLGQGSQVAAAPALKSSPPVETTPAENRPALGSRPTSETKPAAATLDRRQAMRAPAKENMALFAKIAEAIGGEMQNSGEEVISIIDGNLRFDKASYPVVYSAALRQKVVIDPDGKIPASLRSKLADPQIGTAIVPMANGVSIQNAVNQLLAGLGYQSLPTDRPVIVQEEGVAYEAKGSWMALAPARSNQPQEVYLISLAEAAGEIPDYLKSQLQKNGLHLQDILVSGVPIQAAQQARSESKDVLTQVKTWPRDKREMVDALLFSFGVPFGVAESISVQLRDGLRLDARSDRVFEFSGTKTALFFQRPDSEVVKALQETQGVRAVALDLTTLSSREVINRIVNLLGAPTAYREHRFPAAKGEAKDRLTVTAWGFHLPQRSMFVTDRQIPAGLHRFFFEKGLDIVYFQ